MESFKRPELSDRPWVEALLAEEGSRACEHNFASIYLWGNSYPQMIARAGDRLVVQMFGGRGLSYLFPLGKGSLIPALALAEKSARASRVPLTFICLTAEQKVALEEACPGRFTFEEDRDGWDYLYRVDKLAELTGKKLHGKRNHIHRFCERYPDWMFEPITQHTIADCMDMEEKWFRAQEEADRVDCTLRREREAVLMALENMEALGMTGGLIRAEGKVLAFALGSLTTPDCYNVHFEKAFGDIQGAYTVINRETARWVRRTFPEVEYINREDDMGLEGLRRAKLSYYPDLLLEKYVAREMWQG